MKLNTLYICLFLWLFIGEAAGETTEAFSVEDQICLSDKIQPIDTTNIFYDPLYFNWCSSIIKGEDGKYHLFYSRWKKELGFTSWMTHSTIAHAVADKPEGPYRYVKTVLDFTEENKQAGEMISAHNPKITLLNGKYYLYFVSARTKSAVTNQELITTGKTGSRKNLQRETVRTSQRVYVATSTSVNGEWRINPESLLEPGKPIDKLVVNPAVTQGPDKRFYMIVKGDKPNSVEFKRNQAIAISDFPDKNFILQSKPVIEDWDTEDTSLWYDKITQHYYAVFHAHTYIGMMCSVNGTDWSKAVDFTIMKKYIKRKDGLSPIIPDRMERPFVFEENGIPSVLSLAVKKGEDAYIVTIPLHNK